MKKFNNFVKKLVADKNKIVVYAFLLLFLGWVLLKIATIFTLSDQEIQYKELGEELNRINEKYNIK